MFVVLLRFGENKSKAPEFMGAHKEWIGRGFDDGVFLVIGSLQPAMGGAIVAHNTSREDLVARVGEDPFVVEGVAVPDIFEIDPARADERLEFLLRD